MIWESILMDLGLILKGFGNDFWTIFHLIFENLDFMKNHVSPKKKQYFLKVGAAKFHKNSMKNLLKNKTN